MGRPNTALVISESEKGELRSIVRSRSMPHSLMRRAQDCVAVRRWWLESGGGGTMRGKCAGGQFVA